MRPQNRQNSRRTVTACSECHRRKQKCDRHSPCNFCIARNVPSKCIYGERSRNNLSTRPIFGNRTNDNSIDDSVNVGGSVYESAASSSSGQIDLANTVTPERHGSPSTIRTERQTQAPRSSGSRSLPVSGDALANYHHMLPSTSVIKSLVDVFFTHYNPQLFILQRCYFEDFLFLWLGEQFTPPKYLNAPEFTKEEYTFPALLFQVLGLAMQFISSEEPVLQGMNKHQKDSSQEYSEIGADLLRLFETRVFSVVAVQAYLLRSSWLKNIGRGVEAWHCLGTCLRHAQELKLHESREVHQSPSMGVGDTLSLFWYEEYKRRLWANVFVFDGLMSLMLGRPRMINIEDCDTKQPMDCDMPVDRSACLPLTVQSGTKSDAPTSSSATLLLHELVCIIHEMRRQKTSLPYPKDYSLITRLHERTTDLIENAPPFLRYNSPNTSWDREYPHLCYQRENLLSMANLVLIYLHRPHIGVRGESQKAVIQAAMTTLESQQRIFSQTPQHMYKFVGSSFCTIDAALLLCVMSSNTPYRSSLKQRIEQLLDQSTDRLMKLSKVSPIAKSGLEVLEECYRKLKGVDPNGGDNTVPCVSIVPQSATVRSENATPNHTDGVADVSSGYNSTIYSSGSEWNDIALPSLNSFDNEFWLDQVAQIPMPTSSLLSQEFLWDAMDFE